MRRVAGDTALCLHGRVLEREGTGFVRMTGKANHVLGRRCTELMSKEATVRIMAVAAGNESLVDAVMERLGEVGFDL